jgi:hypothetical protein
VVVVIALLAVSGAAALFYLRARPGGSAPSGDPAGDKVVSWIDTRTVMVEFLSGSVAPQAIDVRTGHATRLPVRDVLLHLSGARGMIGCEASGDVVALDAGAYRPPETLRPFISSASSRRSAVGVPSPDGRWALSPQFAQETPTDGWDICAGTGGTVGSLLADGAGSAGGDPSWSPDSRSVAIPLEPGDASEATVVVAWAPAWRPVSIRLSGYQGGPVVFDEQGAELAYAKPGEGRLAWVGPTTGSLERQAKVPGLAGLAGRAADGRIVAFTGSDAPQGGRGLWLGRAPASGGAASGAGAASGGGAAAAEPSEGQAQDVTVVALPLAVEDAVVDPSGTVVAAVCADAGDQRRVFIIDLKRGRARPLAARAL